MTTQSDIINANFSYLDNEKLNKQQISNCILDDPQSIKLTLSDGTATLHKGSVVCVPNGFEDDGTTPKFNEVTVSSDLTKSGGIAGDAILYYNNGSNFDTFPTKDIVSGPTAPTFPMSSGHTYAIWYDTSTNLVKLTWNSGSTWSTGHSFPVGLCTVNSSGTSITSLDQTFQSIGYIGSTVFVRKGLKVLIPNGRNDDGSLNNIECTTDNVRIATETAKSTYRYICLNQSIFGGAPVQNISYKSDINYNYATNLNIIVNYLPIAQYYTDTSSKISNFKPYTAANILKYSDSSDISGFGMPSSKYIDLTLGASGSTYTAPANGYFQIGVLAGTMLQLYNSTRGSYWTTSVSSDAKARSCSIPCQKGDTIQCYYSYTTFRWFRFYYAQGEQ